MIEMNDGLTTAGNLRFYVPTRNVLDTWRNSLSKKLSANDRDQLENSLGLIAERLEKGLGPQFGKGRVGQYLIL